MPSRETIRYLENFHYPGNVRELKYVVELAFLRAKNGSICPEHLPKRIRQANALHTQSLESAALSHASNLDKEVYGLCVDNTFSVLKACHGSRRTAALSLGISERKLYRFLSRCVQLGIVIPRPYQLN